MFKKAAIAAYFEYKFRFEVLALQISISLYATYLNFYQEDIIIYTFTCFNFNTF